MRGADDLEVVRMGERTSYEPGTFCWVGLATPVAAFVDPAGLASTRL